MKRAFLALLCATLFAVQGMAQNFYPYAGIDDDTLTTGIHFEYPPEGYAVRVWVEVSTEDTSTDLLYVDSCFTVPSELHLIRFTFAPVMPNTVYKLRAKYSVMDSATLQWSPQFVSGWETVQTITGISNVKLPQVKMYPNPFIQNLNIQVEKGGAGMLVDGNGREVQEFLLEEGVNSLDTGTLPSGVYYIHLAGLTKKVIKQ